MMDRVPFTLKRGLYKNNRLLINVLRKYWDISGLLLNKPITYYNHHNWHITKIKINFEEGSRFLSSPLRYELLVEVYPSIFRNIQTSNSLQLEKSRVWLIDWWWFLPVIILFKFFLSWINKSENWSTKVNSSAINYSLYIN